MWVSIGFPNPGTRRLTISLVTSPHVQVDISAPAMVGSIQRCQPREKRPGVLGQGVKVQQVKYFADNLDVLDTALKILGTLTRVMATATRPTSVGLPEVMIAIVFAGLDDLLRFNHRRGGNLSSSSVKFLVLMATSFI